METLRPNIVNCNGLNAPSAINGDAVTELMQQLKCQAALYFRRLAILALWVQQVNIGIV
ncbi:MAG: hypothetical protein N3F10_03865 [Candidatus Bathyarchaeota archaeon]|nr:hypothetical protein [Candidatus Bathyarchaeota archaeon]